MNAENINLCQSLKSKISKKSDAFIEIDFYSCPGTKASDIAIDMFVYGWSRGSARSTFWLTGLSIEIVQIASMSMTYFSARLLLYHCAMNISFDRSCEAYFLF